MTPGESQNEFYHYCCPWFYLFNCQIQRINYAWPLLITSGHPRQWQIRKIDAIFWKIRVQFAKNLIRIFWRSICKKCEYATDGHPWIISLTDTYLPYSIFLAKPLFMQASVRELLVPFLHLWYGAAKADAIPTELSRRFHISLSVRLLRYVTPIFVAYCCISYHYISLRSARVFSTVERCLRTTG